MGVSVWVTVGKVKVALTGRAAMATEKFYCVG